MKKIYGLLMDIFIRLHEVQYEEITHRYFMIFMSNLIHEGAFNTYVDKEITFGPLHCWSSKGVKTKGTF